MSAVVLFIAYLMMAACAGALVALWFTRPRP